MNLLDTYLEYTKIIPSPSIFKKWCGLSLIGGCAERRCWTTLNSRSVYPNMFVMLLSPPGIGKSFIIDGMADILADVGGIHTSPTMVTSKNFIDYLKMKPKSFTYDGLATTYHAMQVLSSEYGNLMDSHDTCFLNILNNLYDNIPVFKESTRMRGENLIINPYINLICGTQPKFLSNILPEAAWGMGITSRFVMVYDSTPVRQSLFMVKSFDQGLKSQLIAGLQSISGRTGEFTWTEEAVNAIDQWHLNGCQPNPTHPRLQSYVARRTIHCVKLCMIYSLSRGSDFKITLEDFTNSIHTLHEAEEQMPNIFSEMAFDSDGNVFEEARIFCIRRWSAECAKEKHNPKPIPESTLVYFLRDKVPAFKIANIIDVMIQSRMIEVVNTPGDLNANNPGYRKFKPVNRNLIEEG